MANIASNILLNVNAGQVTSATAQLTQMSAAANLATGMVQGMGAALAGISVGALISSTKDALEFGDALAETSAKLGITAEQLQRFQYAGQLLNTDVEGITSAFEKFNEMVGLSQLGNEKASKAVGLLGDEVRKSISAHEDNETVFMKALTALSQYSDQSEGAAAATKLFGEAGADLYTALRNGEPIEEVMLKVKDLNVVTNEAAAQASELNDKWDQMSRELDTSVKSAFINLAPAIIGVANALATATNNAAAFWREIGRGNISAAMTGFKTDEIAQQGSKVVDLTKKLEGLREQKKHAFLPDPNIDEKISTTTKLLETQTKAYRQLQEEARKEFAPKPQQEAPQAPTRPQGAGTLGRTGGGGGGGGHHTAHHAAQKQANDNAIRELERWVLANEKAEAEIYSNKLDAINANEKAEIDAIRNREKNFKGSAVEITKAHELAEKSVTIIQQKYQKERVELAQEEAKKKLQAEEKFKDEVTKFQNQTLQIQNSFHSRKSESIQRQYAKDLTAARKWAQDQLAIVKNEADKELQIKEELKNREEVLTEKKNTDILNAETENWQYITDMIGDATKNIAASMVDMANGGKTTMADFAKTIITQIEQMIAEYLILWAVQQMVGLVAGTGSGLYTSLGNMRANTGVGQLLGEKPTTQKADGGVFSGGIEMFADGGVVDKPTMFNHSAGKGLMGEAGPEAIMPLARGADGKLGVRGSSGGVGTINITVNVQSNGKESGKDQGKGIADSIKRELKQFVDTRVQDQFRPGNAMNRTKVI